MVTVRVVAVTWDLRTNVNSQCFTIWIFHSQKAWAILTATALAPTGTSRKGRSSWVKRRQPNCCSVQMSEKTPNTICKWKTTRLANLALWEPWTKPHSLGPHLLGLATLWCSQRQKMEGNDSVPTATKSSHGAMSARFGYESPTGGTSEAGRWRDDISWWLSARQGIHCWSTKRNLKYYSANITQACMKAKEKCIKKSYCIPHRGLITKWLIRYPRETTQWAIILKASQSTSLCRKHSRMQRPNGRSKSQPDEQHWG